MTESMNTLSSARPGPPSAMPKEIEALRALLDVRLAALEAALADPSQVESLEQLLFDLARVATEEADATVRKAYADAQRETQAAIAAARSEWQTSVEAGQAAVIQLRGELERAQAAVQSERLALTARERDIEEARAALQRERGEKDALRREFEDARKSLDAQAARAATALREEFRQTQDAEHREHAEAVAALHGEVEQARAALQAERAAAGGELDAARLGMAEAQDARADLARQLEEARAAAGVAGRQLEAARLGLAEAQDDLESARQAAAVAEAEWRSRYDQLRDAAEQQIRTLELALREADNRAEMATLEVETIKRERKASAKDAARAPEPAATPHPVAAYEGPERQANRYPMAAEIEIQIDGNRAWLVDLSLTGAQVLSSGPLKPNRAVRFTLPFGEETISCKGKIVWSRIDSSRAGRLLYRAGVFFMTADRTALTTFLSRYGAA